jgi:hypothetical protein
MKRLGNIEENLETEVPNVNPYSNYYSGYFTGRFSVSRLQILVITVILALSMGVTVRAERMSSEMHSVVIEKLESTLKTVSHSGASDDNFDTIDLRPVRARLADLYAERARLRELEDTKSGTTKSKAAFSDRQKALALYEIVVKDAAREDRGPMLIQMSHLDLLVNEPAHAEAIFERLIREGTPTHAPSIVAQAFAGRAEARFSRSQYTKAESDFKAAIALSTFSRQGPFLHRVAWCELNIGHQEAATSTLVHILKTPSLLQRESTDGAVTDLAFQEEVATDLATFLARGKITDTEIKSVIQMSPPGARLRILKHLASETERLGQTHPSLTAWTLAAELSKSDQEKLEMYVRVARLRYDAGQRDESLASLRDALNQWTKKGCSDDCDNLRKRLRNLVSDWTRAEQKVPSEQLLAAQLSFIAAFNDDIEITFGAAVTARTLKHATEAASLYHKSSLIAVHSDHPKAKEVMESSLVGEIEMAELSPKGPQNFELREQAYLHYLQYSPRGALAQKVRYQYARIPYEKGDMKLASERLETFATSNECHRADVGEAKQLCIQAADLDLDARVLLKNDRAVELGAITYARLYPTRRFDYLKIARTSALNQVTKMDPNSALNKLATINLSGASPDETNKIIKDRMTLAERAKSLGATESAARAMLETKHLSEHDREFALSRLAWVAEMSFDFERAYSISGKMKMAEMQPADRELRLSLLAELAGKDSRKHDEKFLKLSHDSRRRAIVSAKLVRNSHKPTVEFQKRSGDLLRYPDMAAPLAYEVYARSNDRRFAEKVLRIRAVAKHSAGRAIARQLFLNDFAKVEKKIATHVMRARSESQMQSSLKVRLKLLAEVEREGMKSIKTKDWTTQAVTLSVLSRELKRMHDEVVALPVPRSVRKKDRIQYQTLVAQNAQSFLLKRDAIEQKLVQFWANKDAVKSLGNDYISARPAARPLIARELRWLQHVAPQATSHELEQIIMSPSTAPSSHELAIATRSAKESPFDTSRLVKLRSLEQNRGRDTMVAYIDARLTEMKDKNQPVTNERSRQ